MLLGMALFASHAALAQSAGEVGRRVEDIQVRQEQRQRERQQELIEQQRPAPSGLTLEAPVAEAQTEGPCTVVRSVEFNGLTRYDRARFADAIARATGDCVRLGDINALLRAVTNAYVADGHVTSRALVGPQDLNDGTLRITVVEGRLEAVAPAPGGGPGRGALGMAFPGLTDELLNLRDLEQGLDQLNRLESNNATIDIAPGTAEGTSRVVIANQPDAARVRFGLSLDNMGQKATGRYQTTLSLDADNVLGLADFWSFYYGRDAEHRKGRGTESVGGFVSQPYGAWLLSLSGGLYRYDSVIEGLAQRFPSSGESWNLLVNLDRLLYRDADTKLTASAALRLTDTENSIRGIRLRSGSYRLATAGVSAQLQQRFGSGIATVALGVRQGLDIFGASAADTGARGPKLTFTKLTSNLGYQRPLKLGGMTLFYSGQLAGQLVSRAVFPAERFGLGGPGTVRGFLESGISGDNGLFTRHQLAADLASFGQGPGGWPATRVSGFIGYDAGTIIRDKHDAFERGTLQAAAAGVQLALGRVAAEVTLAAPLSAPAFIDAEPVELTGSVRVQF